MGEKHITSGHDKAVSDSPSSSTTKLSMDSVHSEDNEGEVCETVKFMGTDMLTCEGPPLRVPRSQRWTRSFCAVTPEARKAALDGLTGLLQRDRMIDLEVGSTFHRVNFYVPERSLCSISRTFVNILQTKTETDNEGRHVLHLPEDDPEAWKVLIYAQFSRSLPHMYSDATFFDIERAKHLALLVHCWLLGDKYEALQFQDRVMAELISAMARTKAHTVPIALAALHAKLGSPLFQFMAEEEAARLEQEAARLEEEAEIYGGRTVAEDFGRNDVPQAFVDAVAAVNLKGVRVGFDRLAKRSDSLRHMVDGGPDKSWLHVPIPFCDAHDPPELDDENVDEEDEDEDGSGEDKEGGEDEKPSLSKRPTFLSKFCDLLSIRSK